MHNNWKDWHWQLTNRISTIEQLEKYVPIPPQDRDKLKQVIKIQPLSITPYYASLINFDDPDDPIAKMVIPSVKELIIKEGEIINPLDVGNISFSKGFEDKHPYTGMIKLTYFCATKCRFCARKQKTDSYALSKKNLDKAFTILKEKIHIWDILLSGGDPLTLPDKRIKYILTRLSEIPHIKRIRIATRLPVTLSYRITQKLIDILINFSKRDIPIYIVTHFNHPRELTEDVKQALKKLANAGIVLYNQTVLLKGVNDNPSVLINICEQLIQNRVRPYYIFECAPVVGTSHFRIPPDEADKIISHLNRDTLPGDARPHYAALTPKGNLRIRTEIQRIKNKM